jgi:glycosyltransferase involved in cell wall biosynthesis
MLPLSRMTDVPILTTVHGRMDNSDSAAAYLSYPGCSYVSISNAQRRGLRQLNWVKTIYHGIDVDNFTFHEKPGKYLAFLGRIFPDKRPEWAIEIALRSGIPLKIAAKIEGPESQSHYDTYVKPYVDGKFIEYVGEISEHEKSDFLGNALALVFPIDWPEPFGLVMIESLACGTPVLARPCGSVPELLEDGVTGYTDRDIRVLAKRVEDISTLNRKRCRTWVQKRFSLQRMTEDYIHVYRHIIAKGSRANSRRWDLVHPVQRVANGNT